ncbi:MAG TPA: hypothetical protein VF575_01385 [Candidatus Saccharimonadales bacterium]|jgi:hypothetical protein
MSQTPESSTVSPNNDGRNDNPDQWAMPQLDRGRPKVFWFHGIVVEKKGLLGAPKTDINLVIDKDSELPKRTAINVAEISQIIDLDLRYALRAQAVANAMRQVRDSVLNPQVGNIVSIAATDEGLDSRLLHVTYSPLTSPDQDPFIQSINQFNPNNVQ